MVKKENKFFIYNQENDKDTHIQHFFLYYCFWYEVSPEIKEVTEKTDEMKRITMALVDND